MARRMFSPEIVNSDAFLDMPPSTQALYFQLGMRADDDGFVNPKMVMKMIGSSDDELKVLLGKRFLLNFESGVVVIKHWLIHNLIRADLYKETLYKKEKSLLGLNENGAYTELRDGVSELKQIEAPKWLKIRRSEQRTANVPQTALRIGKDRIGKDRNTVAEATPFVFSNYLEEMKKDKQKHVRMIALFFSKKNLSFTSASQVQIALKRHLKPARSLVEFENEKVLKAMDECIEMEKQKGISWTLETVLKLLTK